MSFKKNLDQSKRMTHAARTITVSLTLLLVPCALWGCSGNTVSDSNGNGQPGAAGRGTTNTAAGASTTNGSTVNGNTGSTTTGGGTTTPGGAYPGNTNGGSSSGAGGSTGASQGTNLNRNSR